MKKNGEISKEDKDGHMQKYVEEDRSRWITI